MVISLPGFFAEFGSRGGHVDVAVPRLFLPPIPIPVPVPSKVWLPGYWEYVDIWIPGYYVSVWIPDGRDEWGNSRRGRGRYEKRFRDGYYEKRKVWREGAWRGDEGRKKNRHREEWRKDEGRHDRNGRREDGREGKGRYEKEKGWLEEGHRGKGWIGGGNER